MKYYLLTFFSTLIFCLNAQDIDRSKNRLLWEISGNGLQDTSYLYGTFHSNSKDAFVFPDSVLWALDQCNAVALETNISELYDEIDVRRSGLDLESITDYDRFNYGKRNVQKTAYGSDEGRPQFIDMYFQQVAENCEKSFFPLETIQSQMDLITPDISYDITPESIDFIKDNISKETLEEAYLKGDIEKLHDLTKKSTSFFKGFYKALITDRNFNMTDGLDTLMHQNKLFCAVGAAHLGGPEGIIPLLKKRGYSVRPVKAVYTDELKTYFKKFRACNGYTFEDTRFGFEIQLPGKPKSYYNAQNNLELYYQELGQGNTYVVYVEHYEIVNALTAVKENYLQDEEGSSLEYKEWMIDSTTYVFETRIGKDTDDDYWMRLVFKNNLVYVLQCYGGYRFLNSDRPQIFFDKFKLLKNETKPYDFKQITSPSKKMEINLPEGFVESYFEDDSFKYWRAKYFNPSTGETFYVYESQAIEGNYVTESDFGLQLLDDFYYDSIVYYDSIDSPYGLEYSFKINGENVTGKIRKTGNIIQFLQYTGESKTSINQFLNEVKFKNVKANLDAGWHQYRELFVSHYSDNYIIDYVKSNADEYYYSNTDYFIDDTLNGVSFIISNQELKDFAFSFKNYKDRLIDNLPQAMYGDSMVLDTTFVINDTSFYVDYTADFVDIKNTEMGRIVLSGKRVFSNKIVFPTFLKDEYKTHDFLTKTWLINQEIPKTDEVNLRMIRFILSSDFETYDFHQSKYEALASMFGNEDFSKQQIYMFLDSLNFENTFKDSEYYSIPYLLLNKLDTLEIDNESVQYFYAQQHTMSEHENTLLLEYFSKSSLGDQVILNALNSTKSAEKKKYNLPYSFYQNKDFILSNWDLIAQYEVSKTELSYDFIYFLDRNAKVSSVAKFILGNDFKESISESTIDEYLKLRCIVDKEQEILHKEIIDWIPENVYFSGDKLAMLEYTGTVKKKYKEEILKNLYHRQEYYATLYFIDSNYLKSNIDYKDYLVIRAAQIEDVEEVNRYSYLEILQDEVNNDTYQIIDFYTSNENGDEELAYRIALENANEKVYSIDQIYAKTYFISKSKNPSLESIIEIKENRSNY